MVAEITYLTWTGDGLLRHTVYIGLRSDKTAREVRREASRPKDNIARSLVMTVGVIDRLLAGSPPVDGPDENERCAGSPSMAECVGYTTCAHSVTRR